MATQTLKRPRGKVSMSQAAFQLLAEGEKPMHYRDLTDNALKQKLILTSGKTPEQSLRSQIAMEIRRKGNKSRFVAKGHGIYALSRFGKRLAKAGPDAMPSRRRTRSGSNKSVRRTLKRS